MARFAWARTPRASRGFGTSGEHSPPDVLNQAAVHADHRVGGDERLDDVGMRPGLLGDQRCQGRGVAREEHPALADHAGERGPMLQGVRVLGAEQTVSLENKPPEGGQNRFAGLPLSNRPKEVFLE